MYARVRASGGTGRVGPHVRGRGDVALAEAELAVRVRVERDGVRERAPVRGEREEVVRARGDVYEAVRDVGLRTGNAGREGGREREGGGCLPFASFELLSGDDFGKVDVLGLAPEPSGPR